MLMNAIRRAWAELIAAFDILEARNFDAPWRCHHC